VAFRLGNLREDKEVGATGGHSDLCSEVKGKVEAYQTMRDYVLKHEIHGEKPVSQMSDYEIYCALDDLRTGAFVNEGLQATNEALIERLHIELVIRAL
jgi:hypothetical protein